MLYMVAFCQAVLLKKMMMTDDDDDKVQSRRNVDLMFSFNSKNIIINIIIIVF